MHREAVGESSWVLVLALEIAEDQRIVSGQLQGETGPCHPVTAQRIHRLRVEIDNALPPGLGRALQDLQALTLVVHDSYRAANTQPGRVRIEVPPTKRQDLASPRSGECEHSPGCGIGEGL